MDNAIQLFVGETKSNLGVLMGVSPIGSSVEVSMNLNQVKILLNKYQLETLTKNLIKILPLLEDEENERDRKKEVS